MFANVFSINNLVESGPLTWDMAKQIIQSQGNLAMFAITVVVGVAVLLIAGSWIWHFRLHKRYLEARLDEGERIEIEIRPEWVQNGKGKYGRWLSIVYVDGVNINAELVEKGHAEKYEE